MVAFDFEYDGLVLSDMGYTICSFDGSDGLQTVSNGSQITFDTIPTLGGRKHELIDAKYENCLESTFQICKNPCGSNDWEISMDELRYLMRWLNRKTFHKFKWIHDDYFDLYLEASFNINKISVGGRICGLELTMTTNRPFSLRSPRTITIKNSKANGIQSIFDVSDEEGFIYPYTEISLQSSGTLIIHNSLDTDDKIMSIKNCSNGETLTFDYPYVYSSIPGHKIENDFNWKFLQIGNTFHNKRNDLTISLPCTINISYSPVIKSGV